MLQLLPGRSEQRELRRAPETRVHAQCMAAVERQHLFALAIGIVFCISNHTASTSEQK